MTWRRTALGRHRSQDTGTRAFRKCGNDLCAEGRVEMDRQVSMGLRCLPALVWKNSLELTGETQFGFRFLKWRVHGGDKEVAHPGWGQRGGTSRVGTKRWHVQGGDKEVAHPGWGQSHHGPVRPSTRAPLGEPLGKSAHDVHTAGG